MGTPHRERPRLTTGFSLTRSHGSLAENFSGRNNGIGAIRLALALGVVASHSRPLGFGEEDLGHYLFGSQTNVGNLAVYGFFVLSGLLITRSGRRASIGRYAWHRGLRILPGLWVCLLVSALVVAPLLTLREHGDLAGFWSGPDGPLQYLRANWWTGVRQFGVHDLMAATTPYGQKVHASIFNGALWSLSYEMLCYVIVGILAVTGVLRNARRFLIAIAAGLFVVIVHDYLQAGVRIGPVTADHGMVTLPLIGDVWFRWLFYLGFLFALGAIFDTYAEKVPIHDGLGVLSAVVFVGSLVGGAFYVIGFPAFAYLLVWLGVRMPRQLHWIGRKNDYSYGIYIYGFLGQQIFASLGWSRWGFLPFVAMSMAASAAAAFLSWHLVEKRAMSLKGWSPRLPRAVAGRLPAPVTRWLPAAWLPGAPPAVLVAAEAAAHASAADDSGAAPADGPTDLLPGVLAGMPATGSAAGAPATGPAEVSADGPTGPATLAAAEHR